jgi:hypothetical protein
MVRGRIREFVYDVDRPAFLKKEMMGFDVDVYQQIRIHDRTSGRCPFTCFKSM